MTCLYRSNVFRSACGRATGVLVHMGISFCGEFFKPDDLIWVVRFKEIPTSRKTSGQDFRSRREIFLLTGSWEFFPLVPTTSGQKETAASNDNHKPRRTQQKKNPTKQIPTFDKTGNFVQRNSYERNSRWISLAISNVKA